MRLQGTKSPIQGSNHNFRSRQRLLPEKKSENLEILFLKKLFQILEEGKTQRRNFLRRLKLEPHNLQRSPEKSLNGHSPGRARASKPTYSWS